MSTNFSATDFPLNSAACTRNVTSGNAGRLAPHAASTGLPPAGQHTSVQSARARWARSARASDKLCTLASTPTLLPAGIVSVIHDLGSSTPGCPPRISVHSGPNSCSACRKYRPSVHSSAASAVTRAVPALPVKPLSHMRRSKQVGTYSLKCGSCDGTRNASTPEAAIAPRSAASLGSAATALRGAVFTSASLIALERTVIAPP
mmetsp:Transcript_30098/g.75431  ORF Transcript_30098/g.75431 Transcript_30098/m.75431 type:complete len:204 (+) Transcript_30098:553-1164(+)